MMRSMRKVKKWRPGQQKKSQERKQENKGEIKCEKRSHMWRRGTPKDSQRQCKCMNFIFTKHQHSSAEEVQVPCTRIKERMEIPNERMKTRQQNSVNKEWH